MKLLPHKTLFLVFLELIGLSALHGQNIETLEVEIKSACFVVVATVTKTSLAEGDNGLVTSAIQLSQCEILGSRVVEHITKSPTQPWQGIIDEINKGHLAVNTTSMGFEDEAAFPVELGKRYLFFLSVGASGGLTNRNTLIPAVPWSTAIKQAVLASKALKTAELLNGKVAVKMPAIDPFIGSGVPKK